MGGIIGHVKMGFWNIRNEKVVDLGMSMAARGMSTRLDFTGQVALTTLAVHSSAVVIKASHPIIPSPLWR